MFKDPLVRRFVSGSCFAGAFVWVAVRFFNVEADVVWVLFLFSFVFVGGMIAIGLLLAPLVRLFRRDSSPFLSSLEVPSEEDEESTRKPKGE
ncbi:MAG: hypothetical protein ISP91_10980 [Pseudomonadales bacterium]|jgi:hypothetical protein|nr:hypothetical protein [Pseudomonadales bacterium]